MIDNSDAPSVQGFVLDQNFYEIEVQEDAEAHYLAAVLNTSLVNDAIKSVQTQGAWGGGRDIHRRPFEMVAIPKFDSDQAQHSELAELSRQAHSQLAGLPTRRSREAQLAPALELVRRAEELAREVCQSAVGEL